MDHKTFAIIAGVGPGTGACIARRFAQQYSVVLLSRTPASYTPLVKEINCSGGHAIGISTDLSDSRSVRSTFEKISQQFPSSSLAAAVFNPGGGYVPKPFLELTEDEFASGFESQGKGAFHFSQGVLPLLLQAKGQDHPPTLIFTGSTGSLRGSAEFTAFAIGKFTLRAIAQALAREFGPKGVHVSHVIIDGIIDTPKTKEWVVDGNEDSKLSSEAIASMYWHLHTQPRSTLAFEVDLRPWSEKW